MLPSTVRFPMTLLVAMTFMPHVVSAGCCYSFGYGSRMIPCCLHVRVADAVDCNTANRFGGATGFTDSECPRTADEASQLHVSAKQDFGIELIGDPNNIPELCLEPMCSSDGCPGLGRAFISVFAFDANTGTCSNKVWGGMRASKNNFASLEECTTACGTVAALDFAAKDASFSAGGGLARIPDDWPSLQKDSAHPLAEKDTSFGDGGGLARIPVDWPSLRREDTDGTTASTSPSATNVPGTEQSEGTRHTQEGCCFSYGYGAFMKPCCLKAEKIKDASSCAAEKRIGGESRYKVGQCPKDAQEAVDWAQDARQVLTPAKLASRVPASKTGEVAVDKPSPASSPGFASTKHDAAHIAGGIISGLLLAMVGVAMKFKRRRCEIRRPFLAAAIQEPGVE